MSTDLPERLRHFAEHWAAAFCRLLQEATASACHPQLTPASAEELPAARLIFRVAPRELPLDGIAMVLPLEESAHLAEALGQASPAATSSAPADARQVLLPLLQQATREATCELLDALPERVPVEAVEVLEATAAAVRISLQSENEKPVATVWLLFPAAVLERYAGTAPAETAAEQAANLELLLDVELDASIRFGQRELLLKDILELRPGAVIELSKQIDEPAELLVAGRVVARGEVVVIEGNYGLRITEVLSSAERYQTLGGRNHP